jgi:hypothetical protein
MMSKDMQSETRELERRCKAERAPPFGGDGCERAAHHRANDADGRDASSNPMMEGPWCCICSVAGYFADQPRGDSRMADVVGNPLCRQKRNREKIITARGSASAAA